MRGAKPQTGPDQAFPPPPPSPPKPGVTPEGVAVLSGDAGRDHGSRDDGSHRMKDSSFLSGTSKAFWARMNVRVVQIFGFLFTVLGWIFVACTMAMEYWKITAIGGLGGSNIIKVAWYWSSLWRACFTDSTAVTNCIDFPVLWSVEGYVQAVRGLLMIGLSGGMLGFVLSLTGMECTYIGGKDKHKSRTVLTGGICHIISAMSSFSAYVVYARHVSDEYLNRFYGDHKYDLGTPLFLGWVGAMFEMTGGVFYCVSVRKLLNQKTPAETDAEAKASQAETKSKLYEKSVLYSKAKPSIKPKLSSESALSSESSLSAKSDLSSGSGESGRGSGSSSSSSSGSSTVGSSLSSGSRSDRRSVNRNSYV